MFISKEKARNSLEYRMAELLSAIRILRKSQNLVKYALEYIAQMKIKIHVGLL